MPVETHNAIISTFFPSEIIVPTTLPIIYPKTANCGSKAVYTEPPINAAIEIIAASSVLTHISLPVILSVARSHAFLTVSITNTV